MKNALLLLMLVCFSFSLELIVKDNVGGLGDQNGSFRFPNGITGYGNSILVVDANNKRIQQFTSNLTFEFQFRNIRDDDGDLTHMVLPSKIATDPLHNLIVVSDGDADVLYLFDLKGQYQKTIGGFGKTGIKFNTISGLATDSFGMIFVVDKGNSRILKIDSNGNEILNIPTNEGDLICPVALNTDPATNTFYILDAEGIKQYDEFGKFQSLILAFHNGKDFVFDRFHNLIILNNDGVINLFNTKYKLVKSYNWLKKPEDLFIQNDTLFITDQETHKVYSYEICY